MLKAERFINNGSLLNCMGLEPIYLASAVKAYTALSKPKPIADIAKVTRASDLGKNLVDLKELTPETLSEFYEAGYRMVYILYGAAGVPPLVRRYDLPECKEPEDLSRIVAEIGETEPTPGERAPSHNDPGAGQEAAIAARKYLADRPKVDRDEIPSGGPVVFEGRGGKWYIAKSRSGASFLVDMRG